MSPESLQAETELMNAVIAQFASGHWSYFLQRKAEAAVGWTSRRDLSTSREAKKGKSPALVIMLKNGHLICQHKRSSSPRCVLEYLVAKIRLEIKEKAELVLWRFSPSEGDAPYHGSFPKELCKHPNTTKIALSALSRPWACRLFFAHHQKTGDLLQSQHKNGNVCSEKYLRLMQHLCC